MNGMKKKKFGRIAGMETIYAALVAIVIGLLVGLVILLAVAPDRAFGAFFTIITGGFASSGAQVGIGRILYYSAPLICTGISVAAAFKTGVFNIGASGQFTFGGIMAIIVAILVEPIFGPLTWLIALLAGGIAGAVWALLPAILLAFRNVSPVISGIMMNYLGAMTTNWILKSIPAAYDKSLNWTNLVPDNGLIPKCGMDNIFVGTSANIGIFIAIILAVAIWFLLKKTTLGYEMKICGLNQNVALYSGISVKRSVILSMMIAGFLSGIGGAIYFLSSAGTRYIAADEVLQQGFTGISIALLGMSNPIAVIFSGLLIGFLQVGGQNMQAFSLDPEIVNVITAVVVFFCAFMFRIQQFFLKRAQKRGGETE